MKKNYLFLLFVFTYLDSFCQIPLVRQWDLDYGGNAGNGFYTMQQTKDGGYILGGSSTSPVSLDKTQPTWGGAGDADYWIIKVDSVGNKEWDKDFGWIDAEYLRVVKQTADGGYILGGFTFSGMGGDKSEPARGFYNTTDYWIVKVDSQGHKQWDKTFGGSGMDELLALQQTADKSFILGGSSTSGIGGDKTEALKDTVGEDYWIIKIDSLGNKIWDKDFGGSKGSHFTSLDLTKDGGYILGGSSQSGIGGDKTSNLKGALDYWIIKIDSLGNKLWDKDYGGTSVNEFASLVQTADGGYILSGFSTSGIGGDKTDTSKGYWVVKTDLSGNIQWDKDFYGGGDVGQVSQTSDKGYLIVGTSYSNRNHDKSEDNLGPEQSWIVKTDSNGHKMWDKTLRTTDHDETGFAMQTRDGCYIFAKTSASLPGGDKTQYPKGSGGDYWIIKYCDTSIADLNSPIINFLASDTSICSNNCINFINLSNYATSYLWYFEGALDSISTESNPQNICYSSPGRHDVELIASNAKTSDTIVFHNYVNVFDAPPTPIITQSNDTLKSSIDSSYSSYQWYYSSTLIPNATKSFYVATSNGNYNLEITDTNGCSISVGIVINGIWINEASASGFYIIPNPVSKDLIVSFMESVKDPVITIYNALGQKLSIMGEYIENRSLKFNVQNLDSGVYFLEVNGNCRWVKRFMKI